MASLSNRQFLLMLIGLSPDGTLNDEIGGITRLQKYAFLLESEHGIKQEEGGYSFEPYKAGPYSRKIYDDLEFLENLGLIESVSVGGSSEAESIELESLTFDDLMDNEADGPRAADAFEERRFRLTDEGRRAVDALLQSDEYAPFKKKIRLVKSQFVKYSLNDLLYYVYTKHEDMTSKSEIKERVLRRGRMA